MHKNIVMETAVSTVPHWYASEFAQNAYTFTVDEDVFRFQSHSPLTPKLVLLREYIQNHLKGWIAKMPASPTPRSLQQVEEDIFDDQELITIGKDGVITVEEAKGTETNLEVVEGMQFRRRLPEPLLRDQAGADGGDRRGLRLALLSRRDDRQASRGREPRGCGRCEDKPRAALRRSANRGEGCASCGG